MAKVPQPRPLPKSEQGGCLPQQAAQAAQRPVRPLNPTRLTGPRQVRPLTDVSVPSDLSKNEQQGPGSFKATEPWRHRPQQGSAPLVDAHTLPKSGTGRPAEGAPARLSGLTKIDEPPPWRKHEQQRPPMAEGVSNTPQPAPACMPMDLNWVSQECHKEQSRGAGWHRHPPQSNPSSPNVDPRIGLLAP